jgi:predicted phosphodiesterase
MRIGLVSDLHLSVKGLEFPRADVDVLVLAGDISRPERAMEWARATPVPTVYVAGNHEFYGSDLVTTYKALEEGAAGSKVRVLERKEWVYGNVRFLGCTLWSDFRLADSEEGRRDAVEQGIKFTHDYTRIRLSPDFPDLFTPAASQLMFLESVAWLEDRFSRPHSGPTVVVTHFAPSRQSISPQFSGSPVNACFVSDLEAEILRWAPELWLHGHTHDSFDYHVGKTRVVCNARGYAPKGVPENETFGLEFVVEVPGGRRPD